MQRDHRRYHLGVFGGQGKTTFVMKFIAHSAATCVFLFDPDGEFAKEMKLATCSTPEELEAAVATGFVCFNPHTMFPGRMEEALDIFARFCLVVCAKLPGRKFFVVDELRWYVTGSKIPKWLMTLVQSGRRKGGIDGVFIGQAPNQLHNSIRAQLTEVVCFQITDATALEFAVKFGFNEQAVRSLGPSNSSAATIAAESSEDDYEQFPGCHDRGGNQENAPWPILERSFSAARSSKLLFKVHRSIDDAINANAPADRLVEYQPAAEARHLPGANARLPEMPDSTKVGKLLQATEALL